MRWPPTEYVVFGLIFAVLVAGKLAEPVAGMLMKRRGVEARPTEKGLARGFAAWSLIVLVLVVLVAAYFWFLDPASEAFRVWMRGRGDVGAGVE